MPDTHSLLAHAAAVAARTAAFIRLERSRFVYDHAEIKGLNDLVSYVDKEAEKMIVTELEQLLPESGFIVEENTRSEKREYNWIVDPLDGTTNFVHGIPCYAVSIALEHQNRILLGVVHEVSRNESFTAHAGSGAFLNGDPIRVSPRRKLAESLIATGFPVQDFSRLEPFTGALHHFMRNTHGVRRIGAAAADLCFLACGRFEGFFEYNLKPWDVAAGALIVKEAGGTVCDFNGGDNWLFGREICCTNGWIENEFRAVIAESFKKE